MSPNPIQISGSFSMISVGISHTCAANDYVNCWGDNSYGQVGAASFSFATPTTTITGIPYFNHSAAVAAGGNHSCGIFGGGVYCWGDNTYGQLGDNTTQNNYLPVTVKFP